MRTRRGAAMLIVLMTMTVLIAGTAIIARMRTTNQLISKHATDRIYAQDLVYAAESPIIEWLRENSSHAVVNPDLPAPMIQVLDDRVKLDTQTVRIQITAWDQSGMIPLNANELGLEMDLDEVPWKKAILPGLDHADSHPTAFPSRESPTAIGGRVATHNPWPTRSGTTRSRSDAVININTAPVDLIEMVFTSFNLGDPGSIFEKRGSGELATYTTQRQDANQKSIRLVSVSRVWSFRTDVWVGTIRQSYWSTYANQGGNWKLVQRIGIHHGEPSAP